MSAFLKNVFTFKNWILQLSWKKKLILLIVIFALIFFAVRSLSPKKSQYETARVTTDTVTDVVSESGNVQAAAQFDVYSPSTGYIEEVYVENGDEVIENQKLFKVKSTATQQEKADALANLLQAQSALGSAKATMFSLQSTLYSEQKTFNDLATNSKYENGDGSPNTSNRNLPEFTTAQADWLAAEAKYKNQQSVVNQAGAALSSASLKYDATQNATVTSPIAGAVVNLVARTGEKVVAKEPGSTTNTPELIVGDFSHNVVKIALNEVDVNKIRVGQKVELILDARRDKTYTGTVKSVDLVGKNTAGVVTYDAYITIDVADDSIRPGMTVTASITTEEHKNVLTVPNNAIKPYKGAKAVLVPGQKEKINGKNLPFHYVPVKIGIKGITRTEVVSGVTEGETVVTSTGTLLKTP